MAHRNRISVLIVTAVLAAATGCSSPFGASESAKQSTPPPPTAVAGIEVLTNQALDSDPDFAATCQSGAIVRLNATGSVDPTGRGLQYRWLDTVEGAPTSDFGPAFRPYETTDVVAGNTLATVGAHVIELTVTASNGRKARTTLRVLVMPCACGG